MSGLVWREYDPKIDQMSFANSWPRWVALDGGQKIVAFVESPNGVHWDAWAVPRFAFLAPGLFGSREVAQQSIENAYSKAIE